MTDWYYVVYDYVRADDINWDQYDLQFAFNDALRAYIRHGTTCYEEYQYTSWGHEWSKLTIWFKLTSHDLPPYTAANLTVNGRKYRPSACFIPVEFGEPQGGDDE